ncbi:MAG TPA: HAMP domain-containing protein [Nitrospirae bacterium]|nr:HAMP domain-containing protein [Nitrospirota bacterium]HDZ00530.1 HAMP domain-containing protein [Nitrospirota bacterium]
MLLIVVMVSLLSYRVMSGSAQKLDIVTIEEAKLKNWYSLSNIIHYSKDGFYDYRLGKIKLVAPVTLLINKALKEAEEVKKLTANDEELNQIDYLVKELKTFRQAVFGYGLEIKEGYRGGTSAKEMEEIALKAAEHIEQISIAAVDDISNKIDENNRSILEATRISRKILSIVLIVSIFFTALVALFMSRALAKPIHELVEATKQIAKGDPAQPIEIKSRDEIGILAASFNKMTGDLRKATISREKFQKQIQSQKEFLSHVVESIPYPFYVIDAYDYSIKFANSALSSDGTWKNSTCYAITHHMDKPCESEEHGCPLKKVKQTKKPVVTEHVHYSKDGGMRYYEVHGYPIFDNNGNVIQMIEYSMDITGRKQAEEAKTRLKQQLFHAQKMEAMGTLASGVAHEINTPIQFVWDNTRFLEDAFSGIMQIIEKSRAFRQGVEKGEETGRLSGELAEAEEKADLDYLIEEIPKSISSNSR